MKRLINTTALLLFALVAAAQNDVIAKHFTDYEKSDSFTKISVSAKMFELFTHVESDDPDEKEILEAISKLTGMRMIAKTDSVGGAGLYQTALKRTGKEYEVLMTVDDPSEDITFLIKEKSGVVNELVMIGYGGGEFFVLSLLGDIDLSQISKLARALEIDKMNYLENVEEK